MLEKNSQQENSHNQEHISLNSNLKVPSEKISKSSISSSDFKPFQDTNHRVNIPKLINYLDSIEIDYKEFFEYQTHNLADIEQSLSFSLQNGMQLLIQVIQSMALFMHFPVWTYLAEDLAFEMQLNETEVVSIFIICKVSLIVATAGLGPMADFIGRATINLYYNIAFLGSSLLFILSMNKFTLYFNILIVSICTNNGQNNECVNIQESVKQNLRYAFTGLSQMLNLLGLFLFLMIKSEYKSWRIAQISYLIMMSVALLIRLFTKEGYKWLQRTNKIHSCVDSINYISMINNDQFQTVQFNNDDLKIINLLITEQKIHINDPDKHDRLTKYKVLQRSLNLDQANNHLNDPIEKKQLIKQELKQCSICSSENCICGKIIYTKNNNFENTHDFIIETDIAYQQPSRNIIDKQIKIGSLPEQKNWPVVLLLIIQNIFLPMILWTWVEQIPEYLTEIKKYLSLKEFNEISSFSLLASFGICICLWGIVLGCKGYTKMLIAIHCLVFAASITVLCVPALGAMKQLVIGLIAVMFGLSALEQSILFFIYPMTSTSDFRSTVFNLQELVFAFFATFQDILLYYGFYPQFKLETLWANLLLYIPMFQVVIHLMIEFGDSENDDLEG